MSIFNRQVSSQPSGVGGGNHPVMNERLEQTKLEIDMVTDLFNRMVSSCHTKCIGQRYIEGTLNKGESVCIDRCVSKYFSAQEAVGKRMQAQNDQSARQAQQSESSGGLGSWLGLS